MGGVECPSCGGRQPKRDILRWVDPVAGPALERNQIGEYRKSKAS
jgi:hypothetical protein